MDYHMCFVSEVMREDVHWWLVRRWPDNADIGEWVPASQISNESRHPVFAPWHLSVVVGPQDIVGTLLESCHCCVIL